jgi:hypothetical protein
VRIPLEVRDEPSSITAVADSQVLSLSSSGIGGATQSFYRLFGDINGNGILDATDSSQLADAIAAYNAAYDYNADGYVNGGDSNHFGADLTVSFVGFTPTI